MREHRVGEAGVERRVAEEQAEEQRAVEQIQSHLEVGIGSDLSVTHRLLEERATLGTTSKHEMVSKGLR